MTGTGKGREVTVEVNGKIVTGRLHKFSPDILTTEDETYIRLSPQAASRRWYPFDTPPLKYKRTGKRKPNLKGYQNALKIRKLARQGKHTERELADMFNYKTVKSIQQILDNIIYKPEDYEEFFAK